MSTLKGVTLLLRPLPAKLCAFDSELALPRRGRESVQRCPAVLVLETNAVLQLHSLTTMSFDMPTGRDTWHKLRFFDHERCAMIHSERLL